MIDHKKGSHEYTYFLSFHLSVEDDTFFPFSHSLLFAFKILQLEFLQMMCLQEEYL